MSAGMGYTGRHRHGPRADTTMTALSDALLALAKAAIAAETSEAHQADGLLGDADMIAVGFAADSDEAEGLRLLAGPIRRAKEAAA